MKRPAMERKHILKRIRLMRHLWREDIPQSVYTERNRFRKAHRAGGCTVSNCYVCHWSKLHGYATLQEAQTNRETIEQMRELGIPYHRTRLRRQPHA